MELKKARLPSKQRSSNPSEQELEMDENGNFVQNSSNARKDSNLDGDANQSQQSNMGGLMPKVAANNSQNQMIPVQEQYNPTPGGAYQLMMHGSGNQQLSKFRRYKIEDKRVFIIDGRMNEAKPYVFEVDRGDGEKVKILYNKPKDEFFQLQESLNENSVFMGKSIMREARIFTVTEIDPIFFLIRALRQNLNQSQKLYQTLSQILDQIIQLSTQNADSFDQYQVQEIVNPFVMQDMYANVTQAAFTPQMLKGFLVNSMRVRNSLAKVCQIKVIKIDENEQIMTYLFDEEKLISHLVEKQKLLKKFLASRYSQQQQKAGNQINNVSPLDSGMIKQEAKHQQPKKEVEENKMEELKQSDHSQVYEAMFETIASGFIADELPSDLTNKFLLAVKLSQSDVFFGVDANSNDNNNENAANNRYNNGNGGQIDRKRAFNDISTGENKQAADGTKDSSTDKVQSGKQVPPQLQTVRKSQTASVSSGPLNKFFKPVAK